MSNIKAKGNKGFDFEYTVSHMFQNQGYLTRRGIPLQYGISNQDATDIDVLGIMFTFPFKGQKIICDCKNKVRSKPYERIFWAKGLGEFVGASNIFVAFNKTQEEVIRFASSGGVNVLTSDIINDYADLKPAYGLADGSYYSNYRKLVEQEAKKDSVIQRIYTNVSKLYLNENPYLTLNLALAHLHELSKRLEYGKQNSKESIAAIKYLICELTVIIALQLLWICADVIGLPANSRETHIINKLTYGELEPEAIKAIMNDAKNLANALIKSSIPKSVAPKEVDFGKITPPSYTASLIGLVERALAKPQMYLSMPQLLDFMLFEQGLKGQEHTEEEHKELFGHGSSDERMKASRNILAFIREFTSLDWKEVWSNPYKFDVKGQEVKNPVSPSKETYNDKSSEKKNSNPKSLIEAKKELKQGEDREEEIELREQNEFERISSLSRER